MISPPSHSLQRAFQDALRNLQTGKLQVAIAGFQRVLDEVPGHSRAWHFLGVTYLQAGAADQAIEAIRRAISLDGSRAIFHNNLGVGLLAEGYLEEAKRAFEDAITLDCRYADAVANLGLIHHKLGHNEDAVRFYRKALEIRPRHADALFNSANFLLDEGQANEAVVLYRKALQVQPTRADILNNLGRALLEKRQVDEATECFEHSLAADPRRGEAAFNLGKAYAEQEKLQEAERSFQIASHLRPEKSLWRLQRHGLCPTVFQTVAELEEYRAELGRLLDEALQSPLTVDIDELAWDGFVPPFNLAHHGRSNRRLLEKFAALFAPHISRRSPSFTKGRTRVGFLVTAPHVGSFLRMQAGIVENLDPKRFDVVLFCTDSAIADLRRGIRRNDVSWVPFSRRFTEAVETIAVAACDVLYFHKVSSDPLGYLLPFARLAPVQCTAWTTHFTSGVREVDYYLSSSLVEAPEAAEEYTEELIQFDAFPCFERRPVPIPSSSRADFGLPSGGTLYLCPQRLAKFHPAQDELFRRILDENPTSTLVILAGKSEDVLAQLLSRFGRTLGQAAARVRVLPTQTPEKLRQLMSVCDVLLDIHHYGASLMAFDAFAAGLPIVTLPGRFKVERYVSGFCRKMGIPDLVAASPEDYVRLATRVGHDRDFARHVRERIRSTNHVLFEDRRSVSEFERFAENAKQQRVAGIRSTC